MPPEPGRYRLRITTGSRFEWVDVEVGVAENIETPLGMLRALPETGATLYYKMITPRVVS